MGQCLASGLETVLITQECFWYPWAVLAHGWWFFCLSPHPSSKEDGCAHVAEMGTARKADPNWPEVYPMTYDAVTSKKAEGKKQKGKVEGGHFWSYSILSSKVTLMHDGALFSQEAEHLPAHERWQINSLFCFAGLLRVVFGFVLFCFLLLNYLYLKSKVFSLLLFWFFPSSHQGLSKKLCRA